MKRSARQENMDLSNKRHQVRLAQNKQESKTNSGKDSTKVSEENTPTNLRYGPMPTFPQQRLFTRGVMIFATMVVVYFMSKGNKETALARQREQVQGRGQTVECSPEYLKELDVFPGCLPEKCGRYVSDRLVTEAEAESLLAIGQRGLEMATVEGGAAILDLHSGALTMGKRFTNIYSLNNTDQLFSVKDFAIYRVVRTKIQHAVAHQFGVPADALYLTHPTFFSRLTDRPALTAHDEYWHPHVDKDTYEAFHYTSLLYLSHYGVEFQGGRFIFLEPDNSTVVVEPRRGRVSMFTSGKENLHYIEPVTSGTRYALTVSFSCNHNYGISDPTIPTTKT